MSKSGNQGKRIKILSNVAIMFLENISHTFTVKSTDPDTKYLLEEAKAHDNIVAVCPNTIRRRRKEKNEMTGEDFRTKYDE